MAPRRGFLRMTSAGEGPKAERRVHRGEVRAGGLCAVVAAASTLGVNLWTKSDWAPTVRQCETSPRKERSERYGEPSHFSPHTLRAGRRLLQGASAPGERMRGVARCGAHAVGERDRDAAHLL